MLLYTAAHSAAGQKCFLREIIQEFLSPWHKEIKKNLHQFQIYSVYALSVDSPAKKNRVQIAAKPPQYLV